LHIALGGMILMISCKKEAGPWDRENELIIDTTTLIYQMNYVSHSTTQLSIDVEMLTLEGLESKSSYNSSDFGSNSIIQNVDYTANQISQQAYSSSGYSSVLLFNLNKNDWYTDHFVGYYLRRYFESIDGSDQKNIALSSFSGQSNTITRFHAENGPSDLFSNSWEYNIEKFYELIKTTELANYQTSIGYLKTRLDGVMDTIIMANPSGDKSITLFSNIDFLNSADTALVNSIIEKAVTNQIRINLIGLEFPDQLRQIANETGGFVSEYLVDFDTSNWLIDNSTQVSHVAVTIQNLDRLLSRNVKVHRCRYNFQYNDASIYTSGDRVSYPINYRGFKYFVDYQIP
jgi:hypothetical protein